MTDSGQEEISKAKALLAEGQYDASIEIVDRILENAEDRIIVYDVLVLKSEICWRAGKLDEGLKTIEEMEKILSSDEIGSMENDDVFQKIKGKHFSNAGVIHWYLGDLERAREYHEASLEVYKATNSKEGISKSYNNLGLVYWSKGNLDIATDYYNKSLAICEDLGDEDAISRVLNNLANISASQGELDLALEYHQRGLSIKEKIASKQDIAQSLINIGVVYRLKGNFKQAIEYYNRSLAIQEDLSIGPEFALALNNLGDIYSLTGELNTAIEFYQRAFLIYENMGNKEGIALTLANIGDIHNRKGEPEIAFEYYQRGLSISEEIENSQLIAVILSDLVRIALDSKDTELVDKSMARFVKVKDETDSSAIDQRYRVASALILKKSKRMRDRIKAGDLLEEVVDEDISDHTVTVSAMIHLCELLLDELKATGEEDTLNKIKTLTQRLVEIAQEQSTHPLIVETYMLQSKLAIVAFEFGQAQELMSKAKMLADEKGLIRLSQIAGGEIELLQHQQNKWESILEQSPSKQELVNLTNMNELLERMVQKTVETLGIDSSIDKAKSKYELVHNDLLKDSEKSERSSFRVGIAQIGLSQTGDILNDLYEEKGEGLVGLRADAIEANRKKIREMVEKAHSEEVSILIFPEMSIDLGYELLAKEIAELANQYGMMIIPGSYHEQESRRNLSRVFGPEGKLWEQEKHTPAIIHIGGKRFIEKIETSIVPKKTIICNTEYGRIAITICRDFLDMDLRVEIKNSNPPVDLVINPAFTPVTADFKAAHFDARRSIYAYCFFANIAEFGDSLIYTPEKDRTERTLPARKEGLIVKDVDLFQLRSERKKWETQQRAQRSFIQSTRN
ncbi:MAG: tetratricopeptide repeat protein [Candidatus Thorarchaeota archaeon]